MTKLHKSTLAKRGCEFCTDFRKVTEPGKSFASKFCTHARCPYRVLDGYDSYSDYLKATGKKKGMLSIFGD